MRKVLFLAMSFVMSLAVKAQSSATDVTSLLTNPDFEDGSTGWTITGGFATINTAGQHGYNATSFMEDWVSGGNSLADLDCSQTITVDNGVYVIAALAHASQQGDASLAIKGMSMYANLDSVAVSNPAPPVEYKLMTVVTDGILKIGYCGKNLNANWVAWDNVRLYKYEGETVDAAKLAYVKDVLAELQGVAEDLIGQPMQKSLEEGLKASIAAIANVADYEEANILWETLKQQIADAEVSIALYVKWYDKLNEILSDVLVDDSKNGYEELAAVTYASMDKYTAGSLDAEGVEAELEVLNDAVFAFNVANANGRVGFDVTEMFVTNPTVFTNAEGWTVEGGSTNPKMPAWGHNVMECWNCDFTVSQTINGIPNGKYVVRVQGFYRTGGNDGGAAYQAGTENITAELFANKSSVPMVSLYKYKGSEMGVTVNLNQDYVDGLEGAGAAFNTINVATGKNYYAENELSVIVMDGTLTFGVRNTSTVGNRWCTFRDFKLEYFGNFPALNLAAKIQEINAYLIDNADNIPNAVAMEVGDFIYELQDMGLTDPGASEEEVNVAIAELDSVWAEAKESFKIFEDLKALCVKIDEETLPLNYPGKSDLQAALKKAAAYLTADCEENTRENMLAMIDELNAAIVSYVFSQEAARETPADVSYIIAGFPATKTYAIEDWVINNVGDDKGDVWVGPCRDWIVGTDTTKTFGLNSWSNNFISMNAYQELVGLPDGLYSVVADAMTQTNCLNDQHVYASSTMGVAESAPMTIEGWDYFTWETLTTDLLVVADGKLRIGFTSTSTGGTNGWFQVANFKLRYHGAATAEDLVAAWESTKARADEAVEILLIGDKGSLIAAVSEGEALAASAKYVEACGKVSPAMDAITNALNVTKKFYAGNYDQLDNDTTFYKYQYAPKVAENTIALTDALLAVDTVTYRALEAIDAKLTGYVNYVTGMKEVEDMLAENSKKFDQTQVTFLVENVINPQIAALAEQLHNATDCDTLLIRLKNAASRLQRTVLLEAEEGDVTHLIQNPTSDVLNGEENNLPGWTWVQGNGNHATYASEHYDGTTNRFLDAWSGSGLNTTFYQEIEGLPNGLYRLTVAGRSDGDHAWFFAAPETPKAESTKWAMVKKYANKGGEIWEAAKAEWEAAGCPTDGEFPYFTSRADSTGWGWSWHVMDSIEVTDRYLMIGLSANTDFTGKETKFTGSWMGGDDWKLELIKKAEDGTYDPFTGVENIEVVAPAVKGIYDLFGRRIETVTAPGIYIVNGKKVVIK